MLNICILNSKCMKKKKNVPKAPHNSRMLHVIACHKEKNKQTKVFTKV